MTFTDTTPQETSRFVAQTPDDLRVYAVGDIHGRADLLTDLLSLIRQDARNRPHRVIFLGDYVDRGPASAAVIERLIELKARRGDDIVFLKGNHEQAMLDFIAAPAETASWINWGGDKTLESYGLDDIEHRAPEDLRDLFIERLPDSHFMFLMDLPLWHREGGYTFVHAGMKAGLPVEEQREKDLLWIRDPFLYAAPLAFGETCIVHGHTPDEQTPLDLGWRINIDTGAVWTGRLTAVVLDGTERRFLST